MDKLKNESQKSYKCQPLQSLMTESHLALHVPRVTLKMTSPIREPKTEHMQSFLDYTDDPPELLKVCSGAFD